MEFSDMKPQTEKMVISNGVTTSGNGVRVMKHPYREKMTFDKNSAKTIEKRWNDTHTFKVRMKSTKDGHYNSLCRDCTHEAGHVVCYWYLRYAGIFVEVTVIPSGDNYDAETTSEWPNTLTLNELRARLICLLGGE
ncbi:hypothetical protein niasHT_030407 [Heterodera trifolii]|uniref:Uncharacterized protein n=1 Tax=Heterodera trifolii TaxID=157864 RepID=A0ABD2JQB4_9BILA